MIKNKSLTECKECGFPTEWARDLIILDNSITSLLQVAKDDEYRCSECGHYKDGSTIKKLKPLLREYLELGKKQLARKLKEAQIKVLKGMPIDKGNYQIQFAQGTIIEMMEETIDKLLEAKE